MFDDSQKPPAARPKSINLALFDVSELLKLRAEIDSRLPASKLSEMNLEQELVIQFLTVKELQTEVLGNMEEANKKAQVCNTVATIMSQLVKMQVELHTAERLKDIETRLIKALNKLPKELMDEFFEWYEHGE